MQLQSPRIPTLPPDHWDEEVRGLLAPLMRNGQVDNLYTTLAHHPKLLKRWKIFGAHVLGKSTLSPRDREIAILRVGWLCKSHYEWRHHAAIGKREGLRDEDIERIQIGHVAAGLDPFDATLLRAVDELHAQSFIGDATWEALAARYDTRQILDFLFTVGQYKLLAMMLNSVGIQLEEHIGEPSIETHG